MVKTFSRHAISIAAAFLLLAVGCATDAGAQVTPPNCPTDSLCTKTITIYNNSEDTPLYVVIQGNFQNPDTYLQALFQSNDTFAETHYSRVYINPINGIAPHHSVHVTIPWVSELTNDPDKYADWWNGARLGVFDQKQALSAVYNADVKNPITIASGWPSPTCSDCEQSSVLSGGVLPVYSDKLAVPATVAQQLMEFSFGGVHACNSQEPLCNIPSKPPQYIVNLYVNYNISYVDQVYLPAALAACLTEPCDRPDPTAVGYLGTVTPIDTFRRSLDNFASAQGWPRYLDNNTGDNAEHPRLPSAYNVLINQIDVDNGQPSSYTTYGAAANDMISQWNLCTSAKATPSNCPEYQTYQNLATYFSGNYAAYIGATTSKCTQKGYPNPSALTNIWLQAYVYGWVPFNAYCIPPQAASFNSLDVSPGPPSTFNDLLFNYIHVQYNYTMPGIPAQQRFNPYTELVHGQNYLNANIYAFSVDDASGFESHPGQGLILAIGGPHGLPNPTPVTPPADYAKDFTVVLGDTIGNPPFQPVRPRWKAYGACQDTADTMFPPLPPGATNTSQSIIVDTLKNNVSPSKPCNVTITDTSDRTYRLTVAMHVPWPTWPGAGFDPTVMSCPTAGLTPQAVAWCKDINEVSIASPPRFDLLTPPTQPSPTFLHHPHRGR